MSKSAPQQPTTIDSVALSVHTETAPVADALPALPYKVPDSTLPYLQERFVQEYVMSGNVKTAYITAFGEGASAKPAEAGRMLLRNPSVMARLHVHQHAIATMSVKSTDALVRELEEIVDADANELITVKRGSCRHCWGVGNLYLWRDMTEYEQAVNDALLMRKPVIPQLQGGVGYKFDREPNPECTQCEGEGIKRVYLADTDKVSPGARKLFKGVECHNDGSIKKLLLVDQFAARQELHRIRGMHIERSVAVNVNASLPNAKEIASSPERVEDYLKSLGTR